MPASAPARKRSTRSSRSSWLRTRSSCPRVRGWKARATSSGTVSWRASGPPRDPARGTAAEGWPGRATTRSPRASHAAASAFQARRSAATRVRVSAGSRGLHLGGGQDLGQGVQVVADADPALGERLERGGAASRERVEHDVAGPAVAGDERVGEGRRKAREVRAHRVQAVAPQPWLELPVRLDRDGGEGTGQLEGELARVRSVVGHSRGSTAPRGWAPA